MSVGRTVLTNVVEGTLRMVEPSGSSILADARTGEVECARMQTVRLNRGGVGASSGGISMEFLEVRGGRQSRGWRSKFDDLRSGKMDGGRLIVLAVVALFEVSWGNGVPTLPAFFEDSPLDTGCFGGLDSDCSSIPERERARLLLCAYADAGRTISVDDSKIRRSRSTKERWPTEARLAMRDCRVLRPW